MTEAEIRALFATLLEESLTPAVAGIVETLQGHVDGQLAQLQQNQTQPEATPNGTNDAVSARLANLEKLLQQEQEARKAAETAKQEAEFQQKFSQEFDGALNAYPNIKHREFTLGYLKTQLSGVKDANGQLVTADGKTLKEYVDTFFQSEVGKDMLVYNGTVGGNGSTSTTPKPGSNPNGVSESAVCGAFL